MKKITAIIVNWNGKDVLLDCLKSLAAQDWPDLEIIVSDNGSADGSQAAVRELYPQARLIENGGNLGFGPAVNKGLEAAQGDFLIFLNNDLYLQPDSLRRLAEMLADDHRAGAAVPKILYYEKRDTINSRGVLIHYTGIACPDRIDTLDDPDTTPLETACGGIFMFRREVYAAIGGFDPDLFLYHEDHDLSWRIRLRGWKIMVNPAAVIYHHYHFHKGAFKYYSSEKNRLYLLLKNLAVKTLLLIAPALLLIEMAQLAHAAMHGWFFAKLRSYGEIAAALPRLLAKRRELHAARRVGDREIVRLYQGDLRVGGIKSPWLDNVLSPLLAAYWRLIRQWV